MAVRGAYALRQGFWEKDLSSCSHSSCRLPLPRQVQLKATLALTLLMKFGVMAVPVRQREKGINSNSSLHLLPPVSGSQHHPGCCLQCIHTSELATPLIPYVCPSLTNQPHVSPQTSGLLRGTSPKDVHRMAMGLEIQQARSERKEPRNPTEDPDFPLAVLRWPRLSSCQLLFSFSTTCTTIQSPLPRSHSPSL